MKPELALDEAYHFLPDVMSLLVDTIPKICRSKTDVISFFRGAGTPQAMLADLEERVRRDRQSIGKYEIARTLLGRLNEAGDQMLRQRREVIRRTAEFEDFSGCYENDRLPAEALVKRVRDLVHQKDSFTRMKLVAERERQERLAAKDREYETLARRRTEQTAIRDELFQLLSTTDLSRQGRGRRLEEVLNRLFAAHDILARESFTLRTSDGEQLEQIDAVVRLDAHLYLVEIKWHAEPIGPIELHQHLGRTYSRAEARGIFISASGFTPGAIQAAKEALRDALTILLHLQDLVRALEEGVDLQRFLLDKVERAIIEKIPSSGGS